VETLFTVAEAAPYLRLSVQGVYRAIYAKQLRVVRIGSRIRIPESAVKELIEQSTSQETKAQESEPSLAATV
jgi:excisionase family DNA binding protein